MNFGEIVQEGCDRLDIREGDTKGIRMLKANANAENRAICRKRHWDFLDTWAELAITATTTTVDLPADCRNVRGVWLRSRGVLRWQSSPLREIKYGTPAVATRGVPWNWDVLGGSLVLQPYPSAADTLDVLYIRNASKLVLNSDVPLMAEDYHGIIVDGMIARMSSQDTYDDSIVKQARRDRDEGVADMLFTASQAAPAVLQQPYLEGEH